MSELRKNTPLPAPPAGLLQVFVYLRAPLLVYGPFAVGAPIVIAAIALPILTTTVYWLGGFVSWSFFEYAVHRWVQHSPRIRRYIRRWDDHAEHHAQADDPVGFVSSLGESLPIAVVMLGIFVAATPSLPAGLSGMSGFLAGYLVYDWIHCASHLPALHAGRPWLARWSATHLRHHWERANAYYGFTTSLWDRLLGTYPPPKSPAPHRPDQSRRGP